MGSWWCLLSTPCQRPALANLCLEIQPPANAHPDSGGILVHESCRQERLVCSLLYKPSFLAGSLCQGERAGGDLSLPGSVTRPFAPSPQLFMDKLVTNPARTECHLHERRGLGNHAQPCASPRPHARTVGFAPTREGKGLMSPCDTSLRYLQGHLLPSMSLGSLPEGCSILLHGFFLPPQLLVVVKVSGQGICCSLLAWFAKKPDSFNTVAA